MPWTDTGWVETERDTTERRLYEWSVGGPPRKKPRDSAPFRVGRDTPIHRPHYTDERFARGREHTLFGATEKGLAYDYSDRLWQWDYAKAQRSGAWASDEHPWAINGSPAWYEIYLSAYFGAPWLSLRHIIGGVNVSNGYEYFIFGYRITTGEENAS